MRLISRNQAQPRPQRSVCRLAWKSEGICYKCNIHGFESCGVHSAHRYEGFPVHTQPLPLGAALDQLWRGRVFLHNLVSTITCKPSTSDYVGPPLCGLFVHRCRHV